MNVAIQLFRRSSAGCWDAVGVLGCSECRGAGAIGVDVYVVPAHGFLLLPAGARPSRTLPGHHECPATPQSLRESGTNCPLRCDMGTTTHREVYRNWGHFPRDGAGRVVSSWRFRGFLLLHPFFYSCPWCSARGAACLCPPQQAKTRSGTSTRWFIVKNNPVVLPPAVLNWGQIFPAADL